MRSYIDNSSSHQKALDIHPFGKNTCLCRSLHSNPKTILRFFFHLLIRRFFAVPCLFLAGFNLLICLPLGNLFAQQPTQEWAAIYYGPDTSSKAYFIELDKFGNAFVAGSTYNIASGSNIVTIKYSGSGVPQWIAVYNGPGSANDFINGMVIDDSANIYVTGYSVGAGTGEDFITIKYNSNGIQQWAARYNSANNLPDGANSLALDNNGFVYVTGAIVIQPNGRDVITIKYNALTGDSIWVRRFHETGMFGNYYDYGIDIAVDNQGNCYVTGSSDANFGPPYSDFLTIKYDPSGTFQWSQKYDGPLSGSDDAAFIKLDTLGNIYISGTSVNNSIGTEDYATVKYNSNGVQQWVQRYTNGGLSGGNPTGLVVDGQGNIIVTGYSPGIGGQDYATVKYNSNGTQLWVQRYNGTVNGYDNAFAISVDISDNVYVTGYSNGINSAEDCVTIKYNTNGAQQWVARYNGPGNRGDGGGDIAVDTSGNVYVAGSTQFLVNGNYKLAYLTIKYSQTSGTIQISSETPGSFKLEQNYPNPFNPNTIIRFQINRLSDLKLSVYDINGRLIADLVDQKLSAGTYEVNFDGSNFSSGVYFYRLEADGKIIDTKKFIVLK